MKRIQTRLTLWTTLLVAAVAGLVFLSTGNIHGKAFRGTEAITDRVLHDFLRESWEEKVRSLGAMFAEQMVQPVYAKDLEAVRNLTMVAREQGFVTAVLVVDQHGMILGDGTAASAALGRTYTPDLLDGGGNRLRMELPVRIGEKTIGKVAMAFDAGEVQSAAEALDARTDRLFHEAVSRSRIRLVQSFMAILIVGFIGAFLLSRGITRPLSALSESIEKIGRRDYRIEVPTDRSDEIGDLGRTLKRVAETLRGTTVSKDYLEQILFSLPVGVTVTDPQGVIRTANPSFFRLCGLAEAGNVPNPLLRDVLGIEEEAYGRIMAALRQGMPLRDQEVALCRHNGGRVDALLSGLALSMADPDARNQFLFIVHDITERKGLERKLHHLATHDSLTGLPNRRHIIGIIESEMAAYLRRESAPFWLIFIDLDGFKAINDTHGHHIGDEVLRNIAMRLAGAVREGDMVARLGGDEFLVLLRKTLPPSQARAVADRILAAVRRPVVVDGRRIVTSVSVGLSRSDPVHRSASDILAEADGAMYEAKMAGKDRLVVINRPDGPGT